MNNTLKNTTKKLEKLLLTKGQEVIEYLKTLDKEKLNEQTKEIIERLFH